MRSSFAGLDIAYRALQAQQLAIDIVNHNVANVNTPGFSRQTAQFAASSPPVVCSISLDKLSGNLGTGVDVTDISRARLVFTDYQIRNESQALGQWESLRDTLKQVEVVFNEPSDVGIGSLMGKFWQAWQDLTANPQDLGIRRALVEQSESLVAAITRAYGHLTSIREDLDHQIAMLADEVNLLADRIAALNISIAEVEITGQRANDLRDQRDLLLDDLSKLARVTYQETESGAINVFIGSQALVHRDRTNDILVARDASNFSHLVWETDGSAVQAIDGKLAGLLRGRDEMLPKFIADLDSLASQLITNVNAIHQTGYGLDNTTGIDFFTGTGAGDIAVNASLKANPEKMATAANANAPGDNTIAVAVANLQRAMTMNGGTADFGRFYGSMISRLGVDAQQAEMMAKNQNALVEHLSRQRDSLSGVSLDEEATRLIEYQRAYEAAARIISAVDEMLDKLINGTGLVGR